MTSQMKEFNSFKLVYLDDENDFKVGEVVTLSIEGNEIVGDLGHLSAYALVAEKVEDTEAKSSLVIESRAFCIY